MRPWARDGDTLVLELTADEATMLTRLVSQVRQVFVAVRDGEADHADPVVARLFPDAYDDDDLAEEFRRLTADDQAALRLDRQRAMARDLAAHATVADSRVRVAVPEASVDAWLAGIGDIRIVLHTRVAQGPENHLDLSAEDLAQFQAVVDWLGYAQGSLVEAVVGGTRD
ncbi:hypothetical protein GCM10009846_22020 [Agrococcus versicolor]|uniref:DUF2017 domain-containing protein n=1 Tax=Agrococcus versicolor TaxID=501482 RepID=A0ABN3ATX9_9MICO